MSKPQGAPCTPLIPQGRLRSEGDRQAGSRLGAVIVLTDVCILPAALHLTSPPSLRLHLVLFLAFQPPPTLFKKWHLLKEIAVLHQRACKTVPSVGYWCFGHSRIQRLLFAFSGPFPFCGSSWLPSWAGRALAPGAAPASSCIYLFELLNAGISLFLLTVKPVLYGPAVFHSGKPNSLTTLKIRKWKALCSPSFTPNLQLKAC